ncbi:hypothetical protein [Actinopolymorpha rutila]|uniref:MYXO-CTERM domain-containing protein n=1 Tax=Actinopolymorpha rutila TaxID=446787 RepID=A0A852ZJY1_9ACTN|nr:hypothetical protein [Actinopolymorpha rutila]NYH88666.1 hypothetical protein [Actinopolymorpha rutila]
MSSIFSKKAFGIAAASAAVLVTTPGIALAGTAAPQTPSDQSEQVLGYPGGDIKITCIYDKSHKKWDHKVDGGKDAAGPPSKPSSDATGAPGDANAAPGDATGAPGDANAAPGDANGSGDQGNNGMYSKKDSNKDQVNRHYSSEDPKGSDPGKKDSKKGSKKGSEENISKVLQQTEQSNASKQGQAAVIVLNIGCGNQLVKDNWVEVAQEQSATQQNQSTVAGASAAGKDNSATAEGSSSQGAGYPGGLVRTPNSARTPNSMAAPNSVAAPDPVGAVDGGDGGSTAPNTGLAAGGAGALAAAGLGTVLMRRRRAGQTIA